MRLIAPFGKRERRLVFERAAFWTLGWASASNTSSMMGARLNDLTGRAFRIDVRADEDIRIQDDAEHRLFRFRARLRFAAGPTLRLSTSKPINWVRFEPSRESNEIRSRKQPTEGDRTR
jgi:hypothetical protein